MPHGRRGLAAGLTGFALAATAACGGTAELRGSGEQQTRQPEQAAPSSPSAGAQAEGAGSGARAGGRVGGAQAGFTMTLADSFEPIKVGKAGRKAIKERIKKMAGDNPAVQRRMQGLFSEKIRLFAVARRSEQSSPNGFTTIANVARQKVPGSMSIEQARQLAQRSVQVFKQQGLNPTDVQLDTVRLAESKAAKVSFRRKARQGFQVTQVQYYVPNSSDFLYLVTFSTDQPEKYKDSFASMARTFRVT